jgi:hypothetical protein
MRANEETKKGQIMWFQWIVKGGCVFFGAMLAGLFAEVLTERHIAAHLDVWPVFVVFVMDFLIKPILFPILGACIGWAVGQRLTSPQNF